MKRNNVSVMPHPNKKFGEWRLSKDIAPAFLSTDYKSPPLILIEYELD